MTRPIVRIALGVCVVLAVALLAYLRDPPWLAGVESGFEGWQHAPGGERYRMMGGRASFFVPADHRWVDIPVRAPFASPAPFILDVKVNDRMAGGAVLTDERWTLIRIPLQVPPGWSRKVVRIDLHANRAFSERRVSAQVGEITLER